MSVFCSVDPVSHESEESKCLHLERKKGAVERELVNKWWRKWRVSNIPQPETNTNVTSIIFSTCFSIIWAVNAALLMMSSTDTDWNMHILFWWSCECSYCLDADTVHYTDDKMSLLINRPNRERLLMLSPSVNHDCLLSVALTFRDCVCI